MCLSTPTVTSNCAASSTTSGTCQQQQEQQSTITTATDCNGNAAAHCSSIKLRKTITTTTTHSINDANIDTKDLADNLGYKEENAVYKEVAHPRTIVKDQNENNTINNNNIEPSNIKIGYNPKIRWPDLIAQTFLHAGGLYGLYLLFTAKLYTFLWLVVIIWISGIGITAGAHRLWSHKSYNASLPLRVLLVCLFTIAGQRDAYTWALDHRIHHKFSETDADPHNAKRGFFFAHVGWLFLTPHPKVEEKRKVIDMSDLESDPVVMFQRKWFIPLFALFSIGLPVLVPWYYWNESLWASFWINFNLRFCCTLNVAFFVNSVAHMWGRKPYDKNIMPVESPIVSFLALGEGWHNYHHVFPWDYKTGEFGNYSLNMTTLFIDVCARLGLASGRKSVSQDMILRRAKKCGDGTRFLSDDFAHKDQVWGYGDKDLANEDVAELKQMKQ